MASAPTTPGTHTATQICASISEWIGIATAWLVLLMVGLTCYDVIMRYLFHSGAIAIQELEWHLFGVVILLGAAYTQKHDGHVRVDLIYSSHRLTDRHRQMIDVFGHLFLMLPFSVLIIWSAIPFAWEAFIHGETSPDPGGLSHRWILKATIPLGFFLLAVQGIAQAIDGIVDLRRNP